MKSDQNKFNDDIIKISGLIDEINSKKNDNKCIQDFLIFLIRLQSSSTYIENKDGIQKLIVDIFNADSNEFIEGVIFIIDGTDKTCEDGILERLFLIEMILDVFYKTDSENKCDGVFIEKDADVIKINFIVHELRRLAVILDPEDPNTYFRAALSRLKSLLQIKSFVDVYPQYGARTFTINKYFLEATSFIFKHIKYHIVGQLITQKRAALLLSDDKRVKELEEAKSQVEALYLYFCETDEYEKLSQEEQEWIYQKMIYRYCFKLLPEETQKEIENIEIPYVIGFDGKNVPITHIDYSNIDSSGIIDKNKKVQVDDTYLDKIESDYLKSLEDEGKQP